MASRVDRINYRDVTSSQARAIARPHLGRRQRALFVLALLTFAVASFYTSIALLTRVTPALVKGKNIGDVPIVGKVAAALPDPVRPAVPGATSVFNGRINILIIGVDKRPQGDEEFKPGELERRVNSDLQPYLTDTIMIASLDPVSKTASVLSVPRDLWVDINPIGANFKYKDRINTSYGVGFKTNNSIEAGAEQLQHDLEKDLGITTKFWVWMDFRGVEELIDAVGGVTLTIDQELAVDEDWWYTDDDYSNPHYETFPAGVHKLNGYRAVAFGRYRNDSDFKRVKRQQLVLQSALSQSLSRGLLDTDIASLWRTYNKYVHHNVPVATAGGMLPLLKETGGQMANFSLGDPVNGIATVEGFTSDGGAAVLDYNIENVKYIVNQAFPKVTYAKSTVEIQNGFGPDGPSRMLALGKYLKFQRYLPTVGLGSDVAQQPNTTLIVYSDSRRNMAEEIARWLGVAESNIKTEQRTSETQPDIVIVIGKDFKLPQ